MNNHESMKQYWDFNEVGDGAGALVVGLILAAIGLAQIVQNPFEWTGWALMGLGILSACAGALWLLLPKKFPANPAPPSMKQQSNPTIENRLR